jgi:hypothetical protein
MEETTAILGRKGGRVNKLPGWQAENEQTKKKKRNHFGEPDLPSGYKINTRLTDHRLTEFKSRRFLDLCYRI